MPSALVARALEVASDQLGTGLEVVATPVDRPDHAVIIFKATGDASIERAPGASVEPGGPRVVVVKVELDRAVAQTERRALSELAQVLPVPDVVFAVGDGPFVTGQSFVGGRGLDLGPAADRPLLSAVGALLGRIHAVAGEGWPLHRWHSDRLDESLAAACDRAVELEVLDDGVISETKRVVQARRDVLTTAPSRLIHGDLSPEHVHVDAGAVTGVLDWGDAGVGDPAFDWSVLTLWAPERLDDLLARSTSTDTASAIAQRVGLYRLVRFLDGAVWLAAKGFAPTTHVVGLYEELLTTHSR